MKAHILSFHSFFQTIKYFFFLNRTSSWSTRCWSSGPSCPTCPPYTTTQTSTDETVTRVTTTPLLRCIDCGFSPVSHSYATCLCVCAGVPSNDVSRAIPGWLKSFFTLTENDAYLKHPYLLQFLYSYRQNFLIN